MSTTEFQALINENLAHPDEALILRGIFPPGNIESELNEYQSQLFSRTGDPAIRYLTPFVPVSKSEPEAAPARLEITGALSYLSPSPELYRHPFGVIFFPVTLLDLTNHHAEAPLVLALSTLSPARLEPEIATLTKQPRGSRSGEALVAAWSFTAPKAVQVTLTWLWENTGNELNVDLGRTCPTTVSPDQQPLGLLQRHRRL